jgi:integrase/recombinase XerD
MVHLVSVFFNHIFMLESWFKEKRTLVDFRRGLLGPYFDGFAAYLQAKGYARHTGRELLAKCCQFNGFLLEQRVERCDQLCAVHVEAFLQAYYAHLSEPVHGYSPRRTVRRALKCLFDHLIQIKVLTPPKPERIIRPFDWLLLPYLRHLRVDCQFSEHTVKRCGAQIGALLEAMRRSCQRRCFHALKPVRIESIVKELLRTSTDPDALVGTLRRFFRYCASRRHTRMDFSGLVPPIRRYRHASLPKALDDSVLGKMLQAIPRDTPVGARDYAIIVLMMAYGIRGVSAAQLLLEDLDWQHSRIRIRAQKGGKEVLLPLMQAVGEALIQYLQHRPGQIPSRKLFLGIKAPFRPLDSVAISMIVRRHLEHAGVKTIGSGSRSLRHSWAVRALAHDSPIKSIADVLGHRYIDTTFIYAKADLTSLRQVALPWPTKE